MNTSFPYPKAFKVSLKTSFSVGRKLSIRGIAISLGLLNWEVCTPGARRQCSSGYVKLSCSFSFSESGYSNLKHFNIKTQIIPWRKRQNSCDLLGKIHNVKEAPCL